MIRGERFGVLRERPFRLLFAGQATSVLGDGMLQVATAFAVLELTGSASDLGLVLAAQMVPLVGLVLVGGVWADRLPRQLVMLASDAVRGAVQATVAVLLLTGSAQLWHLVALLAAYGTAQAFFAPAATALVPSTVSPQRLQQANALLGLTRSAGFIVGPAVAGVLVATGGPGFAFAADAATFVVSAFFLSRLRFLRVTVPSQREPFLAELAAGWRDFIGRTWLWTIVLWAATYLFAVVAPFHVLGPLVAKESLGGATAWGTIAAAFSVGTLAGGVIAMRWRPLRPMFVCCVLVLLAAPSPALLAMRAPVAAIALAQTASGVALGIFIALWTTTLQQHVPADKLSRVSAYDWMGSFLFMPIGYAVAGPIAGLIGVGTTLWLSAGWVVASTFLILLVRDVRDLRRTDDAVPEAPPLPAAVAG